jgi:hypothetical protein
MAAASADLGLRICKESGNDGDFTSTANGGVCASFGWVGAHPFSVQSDFRSPAPSEAVYFSHVLNQVNSRLSGVGLNQRVSGFILLHLEFE